MLNLRRVAHLAHRLDVSTEELREVADEAGSYYEQLLLVDPAKPQKPRPVVDVRGRLRGMQSKLYRRLLLPGLIPSPHSHGGIRGRDIKSNVSPHLRSDFVFKADISNFYPSIHHSRVYRLFCGDLGCSPDVARICTKISTYQHHLALGLVTSPILADRLAGRIDRRIAAACRSLGLVFTRFVDDITISGRYDLAKSGIASVVREILNQDGFRINQKKLDEGAFGRLQDGIGITGIRSNKGRLDATREHIDELMRQLDDAASLSGNGHFDGPFYLPRQILGRVRFVCWINPRRRLQLKRRYHSINWKRVVEEGYRRQLIASKKVVRKLQTAANVSSALATS